MLYSRVQIYVLINGITFHPRRRYSRGNPVAVPPSCVTFRSEDFEGIFLCILTRRIDFDRSRTPKNPGFRATRKFSGKFDHFLVFSNILDMKTVLNYILGLLKSFS